MLGIVPPFSVAIFVRSAAKAAATATNLACTISPSLTHVSASVTSAGGLGTALYSSESGVAAWPTIAAKQRAIAKARRISNQDINIIICFSKINRDGLTPYKQKWSLDLPQT
jgi:hypothetical protein